MVDVPSELGPTEFALRTHDDPHAVAKAPTLEWDDDYEKIAPELRRGDVVVFSFRTLHRGLPNAGDVPRPVLYITLGPVLYITLGSVDELNFERD